MINENIDTQKLVCSVVVTATPSLPFSQKSATSRCRRGSAHRMLEATRSSVHSGRTAHFCGRGKVGSRARRKASMMMRTCRCVTAGCKSIVGHVVFERASSCLRRRCCLGPGENTLMISRMPAPIPKTHRSIMSFISFSRSSSIWHHHHAQQMRIEVTVVSKSKDLSPRFRFLRNTLEV